MRLYHGTSFAVFQRIREEGIRSGGETGKDNWKHTVSSNPQCVYLTNAYPLHYALNASRKGKGVIIEIDTDRLDQDLLVPDQDCLAMAAENVNADTLLAVTERCRDELDRYIGTGLWQLTLKWSGNCGYLGTIPVEAMNRAVIIDLEKNQHLLCRLIPTISLLSHQVLGSYYRCLTKHLFGDEILPELLGPDLRTVTVVDPEMIILNQTREKKQVGGPRNIEEARQVIAEMKRGIEQRAESRTQMNEFLEERTRGGSRKEGEGEQGERQEGMTVETVR